MPRVRERLRADAGTREFVRQDTDLAVRVFGLECLAKFRRKPGEDGITFETSMERYQMAEIGSWINDSLRHDDPETEAAAEHWGATPPGPDDFSVAERDRLREVAPGSSLVRLALRDFPYPPGHSPAEVAQYQRQAAQFDEVVAGL